MKKTRIILIAVVLVIISIIASWYLFADTKTNNTYVAPTESEGSYIIVAFGDSLTAGYGLTLYESYPYQLEQKLKEMNLSVKVINAGVSGETSKGNNERAEFVKNIEPNMVILGIGGNDALRALPISELRNNMESTIKILQSSKSSPKILLLKMQAPLNIGEDYKIEFDRVYVELSDKYNLPLIPFLVSDIFKDQSLMLPDGIHPNKEGYAKLIEKYLLDVVVREMN